MSRLEAASAELNTERMIHDVESSTRMTRPPRMSPPTFARDSQNPEEDPEEAPGDVLQDEAMATSARVVRYDENGRVIHNVLKRHTLPRRKMMKMKCPECPECPPAKVHPMSSFATLLLGIVFGIVMTLIVETRSSRKISLPPSDMRGSASRVVDRMINSCT